MAVVPSDGKVTVSEFYLEMTIVWLFILLVSTTGLDRTADWRAMILPVGAFLMVVLHAVATRKAVRAAERLFAASGGNSLYATGRLQRLFRDIHAGASHLSLSFDNAAAPYGQYRMGTELAAAAF